MYITAGYITTGKKRWGGQVSGRALAFIIAVIAVLAAVYFLYPEPEPEPIPTPVPGPTLVTPPPLEKVVPAQTEQERGDTARDVIAELRESDDSIDFGKAHARALEFQEDGRFADAQLLFFFAARGGFGPAALDLATFYDPNHFSEDNSLLDEPDPFQAYKWYQQALESRMNAAQGRLDELKAWATQAAGNGDAEAERLLQQWE